MDHENEVTESEETESVSEANNEGELSDDELEEVAGGWSGGDPGGGG